MTVEPPSNASRVVCSGDGLRAGTMGKEIKCHIDTRSGTRRWRLEGTERRRKDGRQTTERILRYSIEVGKLEESRYYRRRTDKQMYAKY